MGIFAYTALDATGRQLNGTIPADTRAEAMDHVINRGLSPISVNEEKVAAAVKVSTSTRVSQAAVESFTRELANLLAAGLPLSKALHLLRREASTPGAKNVWSAVHDEVIGGISLADAMAKWPKVFSSVYVAMVRAGESGGFLPIVLQQIADFRTREQDLKGKVKAALVYPIVLAVFAAAVLTFLLTFFIPKFQGVFAEFGGKLPTLTLMVVAASNVMIHYGWIVALLLVGAFITIKRSMATEAGRRVFERMLLKTPAIGQVTARFALVRFCRML